MNRWNLIEEFVNKPNFMGESFIVPPHPASPRTTFKFFPWYEHTHQISETKQMQCIAFMEIPNHASK